MPHAAPSFLPAAVVTSLNPQEGVSIIIINVFQYNLHIVVPAQ